ncbi:MAG: flagellar biosynthetic protein FliO [Atribacterota bacterium]|nr:flagellar biosynthetic protein FliO [Atribacterota bacterium]
MRTIVILLAVFWWSGGVVWAQEELNLPEVEPSSTFQGGVGVLRFVFAFLLIIAILWALFFLMKKFTGQGIRTVSSRYMRVVDVLPVRGNLYFYLVQVGERVVMVAQSGTTVREIMECHQDDLVENPSSQSFSTYLDILFRRKTTHEGKKAE